MKMIYVVSQTLSSGLQIDPDAFRVYCVNVSNSYVELYSWYYMPQSLHRILLHEHEIVRQFSLPIGLLSEEAQESPSKEFKKFREHFSCKCSRKKLKLVVLRRLLCSSDPLIYILYISSNRKNCSSKKKPFGPEVIQLLIPHLFPVTS